MNDRHHRTLRILGLLFGHVLFWGWNLLFLSMLCFGFAPVVLFDMMVATWVGMVPASITVPAVLLVLLPIPFLVLGAWKLRSDPGRLLSMFYGVQAPLMLLCLVRIFAIGPMSLPTGLAVLCFAGASAGLLRTLLHGFEEQSTAAQVLRQIAGGWSLLVGLWCGVVLGIYALGFVGHLSIWLVDALYSFRLRMMTDGLLFAAFFMVNLVMLAVYPIAMVGISLRAWHVVHRVTAARLGAPRALAITATTVITTVAAFAVSSMQPQRAALALADVALGEETTDAQRRDVLARAGSVREGLVAARTGPDRLFDADPEGVHVAQMYDDLLLTGLEVVPQHVWTTLMAPFLYDAVRDNHNRWGRRGTFPTDGRDASAAYAALFDEPMARAERDTLLASAHATWNWRDAQAGLLDIGQERVHLDRQELDVEPLGDIARVMVHDVYRSHTWQREEIFVSFSLPEGAAVTGLWLGATDDRSEAFEHVLAPRGAAQEVYEAEVQRSVDPALLEQVGPRQYRLRAFPVLPREGRADDVWSLTTEGPAFHLWLEVVVPRVDDAYPLPQAIEVRNLFWNDETERSFADDAWLPASVPAEAGPLAPHRVVLGGWEVTATPAAPAPRPPGRTAVLVDGTFSMDAHRDSLAGALADLRSDGPVDVWCVREGSLQACPTFDPADALFFGAVGLDERLLAWQPEADRRVVLTDAGSYELGRRDTLPIPGEAPLWLVHLGKHFPAAYGDTVLDELTHTGGGAVASVAELRRRSDPSWLDGWAWSFRPSDAPSTPDPFTPLAGRALVQHLDRSAEVHDLAFFDEVHRVAKEADVVTTYSSMLVLVNERQLQLLADAEAEGDRFDREVLADESVDLSAVPEPTTWLLLALGGTLVGVGRRRTLSGRTAS